MKTTWDHNAVLTLIGSGKAHEQTLAQRGSPRVNRTQTETVPTCIPIGGVWSALCGKSAVKRGIMVDDQDAIETASSYDNQKSGIMPIAPLERLRLGRCSLFFRGVFVCKLGR